MTVVICTWNRCEFLRRALEQMTRLELTPGVSWELLIVDNGCTDATPDVVDSFSDRLPIRRIVEGEPGISNARNAAVRAASGSYMIWTDDDVLVDPDWLEAYARAFARWPDAAVFGGPIVPDFEGGAPDWVLRGLPHIAGAYAARDFGEDPLPLDVDERRIPFGANFAIRAREQRERPYDPQLGRRREAVRPLGEETSLIRSLLRSGAKGWWVPEARVMHCITRERQTVRYLRRYFFALGIATARDRTRPRRASSLHDLWRKAVRAEWRYRTRRWFSPPDSWVRELVAASKSWGMLRGVLRPSHAAAKGQEP